MIGDEEYLLIDKNWIVTTEFYKLLNRIDKWIKSLGLEEQKEVLQALATLSKHDMVVLIGHAFVNINLEGDIKLLRAWIKGEFEFDDDEFGDDLEEVF